MCRAPQKCSLFAGRSSPFLVWCGGGFPPPATFNILASDVHPAALHRAVLLI